jgi:hypothetical protein
MKTRRRRAGQPPHWRGLSFCTEQNMKNTVPPNVCLHPFSPSSDAAFALGISLCARILAFALGCPICLRASPLLIPFRLSLLCGGRKYALPCPFIPYAAAWFPFYKQHKTNRLTLMPFLFIPPRIAIFFQLSAQAAFLSDRAPCRFCSCLQLCLCFYGDSDPLNYKIGVRIKMKKKQ